MISISLSFSDQQIDYWHNFSHIYTFSIQIQNMFYLQDTERTINHSLIFKCLPKYLSFFPPNPLLKNSPVTTISIVAAPAGQASVNCATPTLPSPTMPTYTMAAQTNGQSSEAVYTNGIQQYATGEYGQYAPTFYVVSFLSIARQGKTILCLNISRKLK